MNDDAALLRQYAEEGSDSAFTELVRRHVDLVYGAALRRTGDPHRAADVAQQVFTMLARDARKLSRHAVLGAWLHTATRNAALNLMISEQRRQARELQAMALNPVLANDGAAPDWERLRPVLDAAIDELPEPDRAAVVLRFLERRAFAEIGGILRVSADAARMRTDRALDKLRLALARRGITSTAAALGAIVASQPLMSAPAGLATALASTSLAATGAGAGLLTTALISLMTMKTATIAAGALVVFGLGLYFSLNRDLPASASPGQFAQRDLQIIAALREDNLVLKTETEKLRSEVDQLNVSNARLTAQLEAPPPAAPAPKDTTLGWMPRYERQRLIMNSLHQLGAARDQFWFEKGQAPGSVHELVGLDAYVKTVRPVSGEDYSGISMAKGQPLSVTTPDGMTVTFDPSGATTTPIEMPPEVARAEQLSQKLAPAMQKAAAVYRLANPEVKSMPNPQVLVPYFTTPQEGADFLEMIEAQNAAMEAQKTAPR